MPDHGGAAGARHHRATPGEHFAAEEHALLLPLPATPYDVPVFATPKVAPDRHVEVARAMYSVPGELIGQRVQARADSRLVKVYHRGQLIKTHPRKPPGGRSSTDSADFPVGKADYALRDVTRLEEQGGSRPARRSASTPPRPPDTPLPWTRMRTVYRLLGLVRSYGPAAVDAAWAGKRSSSTLSMSTKIARVLEQGREGTRPPPTAPARAVVGGPTRFARDAAESPPGDAGDEPLKGRGAEHRRGAEGAAARGEPRAGAGHAARTTRARQAGSLPYADFLSLVFADEVDRRDRACAELRARAAGLDPAMRWSRPAPTPRSATTASCGTSCARCASSTTPAGL